MKNKTYKIIICVSLIVMLFTSFTSVFGATNDYYTIYTPVSENALDSKIKSSVLLDALANMINAVGSLIEYLIGSIFSALTGDNIFPWADRIIFNGIGFLDINFLNPADNSLFVNRGETSILGKVVKNVYSTIFSLAVLFLGVAVGIMAIRLAISSIAAEKAKYKQAIVNWATCLVMLFLMHYILAFVFWVNEQLVSVASGIFIKAIQDSNLTTTNFEEALDAVLSDEDRVNNYIDSMGQFTINGNNVDLDITDQFLEDNAKYASSLLQNSTYVDNRMTYYVDGGKNGWERFCSQLNLEQASAIGIGMKRLKFDVKDVKAIDELISSNPSEANRQKERGYYEVNGHKIFTKEEAYRNDDVYLKDLAWALYLSKVTSAATIFDTYKDHPELKINDPASPSLVSRNFEWIFNGSFTSLLNSFSDNFYDNIYNSLARIKNSERGIAGVDEFVAAQDTKVKTYAGAVKFRYDCDRIIVGVASGSSSISNGNVQDIIANLGNFFKKSAYIYNSETTTDENGNDSEVITGWRASKVSVTGALLYAIFVFQSLVYLIMYVKRMFYVIMLSMFGPIVVIYDFFMKSAS